MAAFLINSIRYPRWMYHSMVKLGYDIFLGSVVVVFSLPEFWSSLERLLCFSAATRIRFLETLFAALLAIANAFCHARHRGYDFLTHACPWHQAGFSGTRCHEGRPRGCLFSPELIGSFHSPSQTFRAPLSCFLENVTFFWPDSVWLSSLLDFSWSAIHPTSRQSGTQDL